MPKILLIIAMFFSTTAMAQNYSAGKAPQKASGGINGLYLGAEYMNLTDQHIEVKAKAPYTGSAQDTSGMHLGMAGVRAGLNWIPQFNTGVNLGLRFLQAFNKSEYGSDATQIIIPELNLLLAAGSSLYFYGGINMGKFLGSQNEDMKSELGAQAGLGLSLTRSIVFNAGYTLLHQSYSNAMMDADLQISGFNSSLNYTF